MRGKAARKNRIAFSVGHCNKFRFGPARSNHDYLQFVARKFEIVNGPKIVSIAIINRRRDNSLRLILLRVIHYTIRPQHATLIVSTCVLMSERKMARFHVPLVTIMINVRYYLTNGLSLGNLLYEILKKHACILYYTLNAYTLLNFNHVYTPN